MKHILVIDDEEALLDALVTVLDHAGYRVTGSSDAGPIDLVIGGYLPPPCLVLMDVFLQGQSGVELTRRLKLNPPTAALPVILMSAQPLQAQEAAVEVADQFLAKPFDCDQLLEAIERHMPTSIGGSLSHAV